MCFGSDPCAVQRAAFGTVSTPQCLYGPDEAGGERISQEKYLFCSALSCLQSSSQDLHLTGLSALISDQHKPIKFKGEEAADVRRDADFKVVNFFLGNFFLCSSGPPPFQKAVQAVGLSSEADPPH